MFEYARTAHTYSLAVVGLSSRYDRTFATREAANEYMYRLCAKYGLSIVEVWDDHHDKTYNCTNGVSFYIQRYL